MILNEERANDFGGQKSVKTVEPRNSRGGMLLAWTDDMPLLNVLTMALKHTNA